MNVRSRYCLLLVAVVCAGAVASRGQTNGPAVTVTNGPSGVAGSTNLTEITSTQLRMDTEKKIAYFDGNVLVIDPQFQLRANRLVVFLSPSGSGMERAEAYDDVIIVQEQEKRRSHSQKAVYTPADGKMVLTGDPSIENEKCITRGQVITIFRTNNVVLVEGGTRTLVDLSSAPSTNAAPRANVAPQTNAPPQTNVVLQMNAAPQTNEPPKAGSN